MPVNNPARRVAEKLKSAIIKEIQALRELKIIGRVKESTPWVNSLVAVSKPNGDVRLCLDARKLNKAIIPKRFRLKTMDELKNLMPGAKIFSKLDLSKGFHQVLLDDESAKLTTFNTPIGTHCYLRLPFGIKDASEAFQEIMEEEFGEFAIVLIDDLLIWGKDREEHDEKLRKVLEKAKKINVTFNKSKLEIAQSEVAFAGHIVSKDGLKPDPKKIQAISEMPEPKNKEALQSLLGMISYLSKFIPRMSEVTEPLRRLDKKNVIFRWGAPQKNALKVIKDLLVDSKNLQYYDVEKSVTLQVDASCDGLGACLMQSGHVIEFASASLTETQKNYS